jgi:hypothetical protein
MASSGTVPLLRDVEGAEVIDVDDDDDRSAFKNDFAYHNNVMGAAKHIRMGKEEIQRFENVYCISYCKHSIAPAGSVSLIAAL